MEIQIKIPYKIFGRTVWTKKRRRPIPESWTHIADSGRRLTFVRTLALLPHDEAMPRIVQTLLDLPKRHFNAIEPEDIAAIADKLDWMRLEPSTQPIFDRFEHEGKVYALPKPEFDGGTAYEFAQADDHYTEWLENPDAPEALLRLVATLARTYSSRQLQKTGDARRPLSTNTREAEHDIQTRADELKNADIAIIMSVLRYFEGVKKDVHEYGTASGIFEKPKDETDDTQNPKPKTQNLFGWWTAYRTIAKSQLKTEEQIWQMSLWHVLAIMIEEKTKADEAERQIKLAGKD